MATVEDSHKAVTEDGFPRKHGNDFGDHAERGQHHDVDLGMPEEPEVVLPQKRRAAARGIEEEPVELPVGQQHDQRGRQRGKREHDHYRIYERHPDEQRQAPHRHAFGAQGGDGDDEIDGRGHRSRAAISRRPAAQ